MDRRRCGRQPLPRGRAVVVGGPDGTSRLHVCAEADHRVLGEAELNLPRFVEDWARGDANRHVGI